MLRGLDYRGTGSDDVPMMIKVAERPELDAEVTVYLRDAVSTVERERQQVVEEEMDRLDAAGVLGSMTVESWDDVRVGDCYDEFAEAVGAEALAPFFEEKADGNAIEVPAVCIALREDGELTGLYPRRKDGTEQTVGDCIRALASGDRVENVA